MAEQSKLFYTELASIVEDFTCFLFLVSLSGTCKLNFQLAKYFCRQYIFFLFAVLSAEVTGAQLYSG